MIKIYIDVYFFINFAVDYISLFSVEKMLFLPESKKRCFLGALFGALWSVAAFLFAIPKILHIPALAATVMLTIGKKGWRMLLYGGVVFVLVQIFLGGAIYAIREICGAVSKKSLVLAGITILLSVFGSQIFSICSFIARRRLQTVSLSARLTHRGRQEEILLMIDSGNLVRDIESGRRVIFVNAGAIKKIAGECETLFEREKCYVIPIVTASGNGSVMGFIPDRIEFSDKKYNNEKFIVVPDMRGRKFAGYDGIAPLI